MARYIPRSNTSRVAEFWRTVDQPLLLGIAALAGAGLIFAGAAGTAVDGDDPFRSVYRHALFLTAATAGFFITAMMSPKGARRLAALAWVGALILLAIVPFTDYAPNGAKRWIPIGSFTLQPSEFIKPAILVLAAWALAQRERVRGVPWEAVAIGLAAVPMAFLVFQPDAGQTLLIAMSFGVVFFIAGMSWRWAAAMAGGAMCLAVGLFAALPHVRDRVMQLLNPNNEGSQIGFAAEAISRGGLLGVGPGEGKIKSDLPEAHNDFIYAVVSEEFGLIAALAIIGAIAFVSVRGLLLSARLADPASRGATAGLFALFGFQAAINLMVNLDIAPPTGMTLPLISYGGSSMMGTAFLLGLAMAFLREVPQVRAREGIRADELAL